MLTKLRHWWQEKRARFWSIPAVMVLNAVVLAILLVTVDANVDLHIVEHWLLLFGAVAAGAPGLLTTYASSLITVAGVVFSITIVALSGSSSFGKYLFVSLFRTCAESLASENASRMAAMQSAGKNINELLEELKETFHRLRQGGIYKELFDIYPF